MRFAEDSTKIEIIDENVKILIPKRENQSSFKCILARQIHSDIVCHITSEPFHEITADALITSKPNLSIGVKTADCLAVLMYSREKNIVAAVHCGWRGTSLKIVAKTIEKMRVSPEKLKVVLSHCICEKCYMVRSDMKNEFIKRFGKEGELFFKKLEDDSFLFNLKGANLYAIKSMGIPLENIVDIKKCTVCNNPEFFSYRKEKTEKRNLNIISLI